MKKDKGPVIFMVLLYTILALYMGYGIYVSVTNSAVEKEKVELLKRDIEINKQLIELLRRGENENQIRPTKSY